MLGDIETCETFFFTYSSFQRFTFNIPTIFRCPAHRLLKVPSYRPTSSLSCNPLLQLPPIVAFFLPLKGWWNQSKEKASQVLFRQHPNFLILTQWRLYSTCMERDIAKFDTSRTLNIPFPFILIPKFSSSLQIVGIADGEESDRVDPFLGFA